MKNLVKENMKRIMAFLLVIVVGAGAYYGYTQLNGGGEAARTVFADTTPVERVSLGDMRDVVTASGVVYLKDEQIVYSSTDAKVKEVLVEVGDQVVEGAEIVTYEVETTRENLERQIKEAEISLSNQQISLKSLMLPASQSEITNLEKQVDNANDSVYNSQKNISDNELKIDQQKQAIEKARLELEKAEKTISDTEILLQAGAVSQETYDDAVTARDNKADTLRKEEDTLETLNLQQESNLRSLHAAEKTLQTAQKDLADAGVVLAEESEKLNYQKQVNQISLSQISLDNLKKQLNEVVDSDVSPISGTVTTVSVSRGSKAEEDTVLLKVADFNQLIVKADISEYDTPKLVLGQKVTMTSDGLSNVVYTGTITKISNSASTQSAVSGSETVVPIEISVDNPDGKVKPGFNLDLEILIAEQPSALGVSISAVQKDKQTEEYYVFVVERQGEERILKKTTVTLGIYTDMQVEITSGLSEGDMVLTSPTADMQDGQPLPAMGSAAGAMPSGGNRQNGGMGGMGGMGAPAIRMGGGGGMGGSPPAR